MHFAPRARAAKLIFHRVLQFANTMHLKYNEIQPAAMEGGSEFPSLTNVTKHFMQNLQNVRENTIIITREYLKLN